MVWIPNCFVLTDTAFIFQGNYFFIGIFDRRWKLILMKLYIPLIPKESFGLSGTQYLHFDFLLC